MTAYEIAECNTCSRIYDLSELPGKCVTTCSGVVTLNEYDSLDTERTLHMMLSPHTSHLKLKNIFLGRCTLGRLLRDYPQYIRIKKTIYEIAECDTCFRLYHLSHIPNGNRCQLYACLGKILRKQYDNLEHQRSGYLASTISPQGNSIHIGPHTLRFLWINFPQYIKIAVGVEPQVHQQQQQQQQQQQEELPSLYDILKTKEKEFKNHVVFFEKPIEQFDSKRIDDAEKSVVDMKEAFEFFKYPCLETKFMEDHVNNLTFKLAKLRLLSKINDAITDSYSLYNYETYKQFHEKLTTTTTNHVDGVATSSNITNGVTDAVTDAVEVDME